MDEERQKNLDKIYNCTDIECVAMLRMRKAPFFALCNLLRERQLLSDSLHSCVEEQLAMFLHIVGHNQRFRVIHQHWRRSIETVHRYFKEVLYAIGELRQEMIRAPSNETPVKISNSPRWYPYFKDCVGAIDGTHVYARVPAKIQAAFRGRKHYPTQNVLAAVDFDLKFTYVLAGWEGSAHDATVLADALEREDGLRVPPGMAEEMNADILAADELVFPGGAVGADGDDGPVGAVGVPPGAAQQRPAMRWTDVMSGFILHRMCQLISTGVRTDKGFKEVHLNQVAKALHEFSGNEVTGTQVYNHLRKWRQRWVKISKLRELSGALWNGDSSMIVLEEEHYNGHIKAHPKDAEYLNKPIVYYQEMMVIFGNGQATGKYAMGSNEALGSPSEFAYSPMKHDLPEELTPGKPEAAFVSKSEPPVGSKRKRSMLSDDDVLVFTGMTDAVNNVADAIRSTKVEDSHPDLYGALMYMPGFSEEALMLAYGHLLNNKAQGSAFVQMSHSHRVLWLSTYLAKNNYM
ncbi:uncharacterized protein [Setaria viridis]|uniref:uncharacterized protein n=1 Tax=Setaria viridis TaxID=4556 RepID=UPI003B3BD9E4